MKSFAHKWCEIAAQKELYFFVSVPPPQKNPTPLKKERKKKFKQPLKHFFLQINHATSPKLYWSCYPHPLRDSLSPVCAIFLFVSVCLLHFCLFGSVSVHFCLFLFVSECFCLFLWGSVPFCPFFGYQIIDTLIKDIFNSFY